MATALPFQKIIDIMKYAMVRPWIAVMIAWATRGFSLSGSSANEESISTNILPNKILLKIYERALKP